MHENSPRWQHDKLVGQRLIDEIRELAAKEHDSQEMDGRETPVGYYYVRYHGNDGDDKMLMWKHEFACDSRNPLGAAPLPVWQGERSVTRTEAREVKGVECEFSGRYER